MTARTDAAVEAALEKIRLTEQRPARADGEPVPDHAPDLLGSLQRAVDAARAERRGGAA